AFASTGAGADTSLAMLPVASVALVSAVAMAVETEIFGSAIPGALPVVALSAAVLSTLEGSGLESSRAVGAGAASTEVWPIGVGPDVGSAGPAASDPEAVAACVSFGRSAGAGVEA